MTAASGLWDRLAAADAVHAAAAAPAGDWFAKYPGWLRALDLGGMLLDAGCGYGRIAIPLLEARPALRVIGLDGSDVMLGQFAGLLASRPACAARVSLVRADLRDMPLGPASIDSFVTSAVLLHSSYRDAARIVAGLFRALRPGGTGVFISSFPNLWSPSGVLSAAYAAAAGGRNGPVRPYRRAGVLRLLAPYCDPARVRVWSDGVTLLPKQVYRWSWEPYRRLARSANRAASGLAPLRDLANRTGVLASGWDVVCVKREGGK